MHTRHIWWRDLLVNEGVDVKVSEPRVLQDLVDSVGTETVLPVLVQQLHDEVLGLR